MFQSLIGMLKTGTTMGIWSYTGGVSIPHRYAENFSMYFPNTISSSVFQSLIGMLKTLFLAGF